MTYSPCAVPAFSYLDFSLAAVARASDLTESVARGVVVVVVVVLNDNVVDIDDENDEPRPSPSVVR